jgi:hypothetical protein
VAQLVDQDHDPDEDEERPDVLQDIHAYPIMRCRGRDYGCRGFALAVGRRRKSGE